MRVSVILLVVALLGVLGGGWLAGGPAGLGGCLIFDSLAVGAWALLRDDGQESPVHEVVPPAAGRTLAQVFARARAW